MTKLTLYPHQVAELFALSLGNPSEMDRAIIDWAFEDADYDGPAIETQIAAAVSRLEQISCAACHAPHGLIYNNDLAMKARDWWEEIDAAFDDYHDNTGEHAKPQEGTLTIGWCVWFAVEWRAYSLASMLSNTDPQSLAD